ncbi:MAG: pirin family protein [Reyranella sp.]|uniref:pirin family protein n=1 Tax=Reyranella sp. TaxID=1929291 RepID=UPI001AC51057|nr:pirin family protein [Reyranella sp.]MBN9090381.1 pirin family protein [Reyranella sp.]
MKKVVGTYANRRQHWVGDGFPVRTLFSYDTMSSELDPFLLLDFAGPVNFDPATRPRGVGRHPHRGFETVTIVYDGEVAHRDSTGHGGVIGRGDVQWMTAAGGILHEEFHSPAFTRSGGPFRMIQLWVNLPARDKMSAPGYQAIVDADIPAVELPDDAGKVRVIAGAFAGTKGPAKTFTPINVWDMRLEKGTPISLDLPAGHTAALVVLSGRIIVNNEAAANEAEMVLLDRDGSGAVVQAEGAAAVLVLTGEPIGEPVVGQGPFVMNTQAEIRQAIDDFNNGRF